MTVQEMIFAYDMQKILDACCAILPDYIDPNRYRPGLHEYLSSLRTLTPKPSNNLIVSRLVKDFDGEEYYDACSVHEYDTERLCNSYNMVQQYKTDMDKAYLLFNTDHDTWNDLFYTPVQYAFEFTPTIEILGYQIVLPDTDGDNLYKAIAAVIDEITFFGFDEQDKEDKLNEVQKSADDLEKILELPEEDREEMLCSLQDLFPGMEIPELTEEEKIEIRKNLVRDCFENIEYMYKLLCINKQ